MENVAVPVVLQRFGATPMAAVLGAVRSQHSLFKRSVKRAASRLGLREEERTVDGEKFSLSYTADTKDDVTMTAAKLLLLLKRNPVAVGDELLRTWSGQSQGEWKADRCADWSDYVLEHPSLNSVMYSQDKRQSFEPITMTIVAGALLALLPVVLPVLLSMIQDFFKSEQEKAAQAQKDAAAEKKRLDEASAEKSQTVMLIIGGVVVVGVLGVAGYFLMKSPKGGAA